MKRLFFIFTLSLSLSLYAQEPAAKKRPIASTQSYHDYQKAVRQHANKTLIDIEKAIPDIVLDIRYATSNNFMKQVMYPEARAFARQPVVIQLKKIQKELRRQGYGLKIYDAYRPFAITLAFYEKATDKDFVASPYSGSKHNRGCAIDLTLINYKTKEEIPMPTPYDSFEPQAAATYKDLDPKLIKNRDFLIKTMESHGFRVLHNEWWHFDFIGWQQYELLNIPFKQL